MKMFGQRKYHFCWRIKTVRQRQEVIVFFEEGRKTEKGKGGNVWKRQIFGKRMRRKRRRENEKNRWRRRKISLRKGKCHDGGQKHRQTL